MTGVSNKNHQSGESNSNLVRLAVMLSTAISGAWYLPARKELELLFASGRRYRYFGVSPVLAQRFADAVSKGQFFNREIRNRFRCRELDSSLSQVA